MLKHSKLSAFNPFKRKLARAFSST
jgi:sarcosine dehydrogenase